MLLTGFINHNLKEEKCTKVVIDITDEKRFGFISEGDITDLNRVFEQTTTVGIVIDDWNKVGRPADITFNTPDAICPRPLKRGKRVFENRDIVVLTAMGNYFAAAQRTLLRHWLRYNRGQSICRLHRDAL